MQQKIAVTIMSSQSKPLRILQCTDFHLASDPEQVLNGVQPDKTFQQLIEYIGRTDAAADFLLATGDLSDDGSVQAYVRLCQYFMPLQQPVLCMAGNHDKLETLRSTLQTPQISCPRAIIHGQWQLILLNTTVPGQSAGYLDESELAHLHQCLRDQPDLNGLICLHHQPVPVGSLWMDAMGLQNSAQFFEVLDCHPQVRGVVWGHIHQAFDQQRKNVRLLGSPSTCVQVKPGSKEFALDDKPPGYRWIDLYNDGKIKTGIEWVDMPGQLKS